MEEAFDAFISYSRTDDLIARTLRHALEHQVIEIPSGEKRRIRIFLDRNDMPTGAYYDLITERLASSSKLIVLCSPAASASHFVNDEIDRFLQTHTTADIVPILVRGDLADVDDPSAGKSPFPPSLVGAMGVPAVADLRHFRGHWRRLRWPKHAEPWYSILSQLTDVPRRELEQVEQKRVRARWIWTLAGSLSVITLLSIALTSAIFSREEAKRQQAIADNRSKSLVSADIARHVINATDLPPDRSMLLGGQAALMVATPSSLGALVTSIERNRTLHRILRLPGPLRASSHDNIPERVRSVASTANGEYIAVITDKHWLLWRTESRELISQGDLDQDFSQVFFATPQILLLRDSAGGGIFSLSPEEKQTPRRIFSEPIVSASAAEATATLAIITGAGALRVLDVRNSSASYSIERKFSSKAVVQISPDGRRVTVLDLDKRETFEIGPAGLQSTGPAIRYRRVDQDAIIQTLQHNLPRIEDSLAARLGADRVETLFSALQNMRGVYRGKTLVAQLSPAGDALLIGSGDGTVLILDTTDFETKYRWTRSQYDGTSNQILRTPMDVSWSADGKTIVSGFMDGEIWVWRLQKPLSFVSYMDYPGKHVSLLRGHGSSTFELKIDEETYGLLRTKNGYEEVISGNVRAPLPSSGKEGRVFMVVGSGGPNSQILLLERVRTEGDYYLANAHDDPDGRVLFIYGDRPNTLPRRVEVGWRGMVVSSEISGDESTFAIGREDGALELIDVKSGTIFAAPIGGTYAEVFKQVKDIALSWNGQTVWWVNGSNVLRKWSKTTGSSGTEDFRQFDEKLISVAVYDDGRYLAVGDVNGGVRLIESATLNSVSSRLPIFSDSDGVERLAAWKEEIAVQSGDRVAIVDLNPGRLIELVCQCVGRGLTQSELDTYTHGMAVDPLCRKERNQAEEDPPTLLPKSGANPSQLTHKQPGFQRVDQQRE